MNTYTPQSAFAMGILIGMLLPIIGYGVYRIAKILIEIHDDNIRDEVEREYKTSTNYAPAEPSHQVQDLYWYGAKSRYCPTGYVAVEDSDDPRFYCFVGYTVSLSEQEKDRYGLTKVTEVL